MDIAALLARIRGEADCLVYHPSGIPQIESRCLLPDDVRAFYELCGGLVLFKNASFPTHVMSPDTMVLANPIIVGSLYEYDISSSWYIIASDGSDSQKMTIDLSPERLSHYYDSFWDRHAVAGSSTIIALSFTAFLEQSFAARGQDLYWDGDGFVSPGDAYTGVPDTLTTSDLGLG